MKLKPILLALGSGTALALVLSVPRASNAQAAASPAPDPALNEVILAVNAQQAVIAENQIKLEEKLKIITEDLRIARIYVGRAR